MATVSVIVNTLNEEANLADCLASIKELADEIVVVDMHSDDRTATIAKRFGAKVYQHRRMGYVEPARNFAFSKATGDWIFLLDADERATAPLRAEIKRIIAQPEAPIYYVARKNLLMGRWVQHGSWWPDYQMRLWKRGAVTWPTEIHAFPEPTEPTAHLAAEPDLAILHHAYNSITEFIGMINSYTAFEVENLHAATYRFRRRHLIISPLREFWQRYIGGKGYRDGFDGLVLAFLLTFYRGVIILKYWEKYSATDFHDKNQSLLTAIARTLLDR